MEENYTWGVRQLRYFEITYVTHASFKLVGSKAVKVLIHIIGRERLGVRRLASNESGQCCISAACLLSAAYSGVRYVVIIIPGSVPWAILTPPLNDLYNHRQ
jgi:hypothetical protein